MQDTIKRLNCVMQYLNMKIKDKPVEIIDLQLLIHTNEMASRKRGRIVMDSVTYGYEKSYFDLILYICILRMYTIVHILLAHFSITGTIKF